MTITELDFSLMDAEPTEAAPTEDATQSIYAWSQAEDETLLIQRRSWKLPIAVAVLAIAAATTVGVVKVWPHRSTPENPAAQAATHVVMPTAAAPTAPAATPSSAPIQPLDPDKRFVSLLEDQGWTFSVPDTQVAQEGRGICRDLSDGRTFDQEVNGVATGSGIEPSHARRFIITAADVFCPQYSPR